MFLCCEHYNTGNFYFVGANRLVCKYINLYLGEPPYCALVVVLGAGREGQGLIGVSRIILILVLQSTQFEK